MVNPLPPTHLLDNLTTAILLVDAQLRVSYLNAAAESLLEVSGSRILGEPISNVFQETDQDRNGLLRARESGSGITKRQASLILASRQQIVVDYVVTPLGEDVTLGFVLEIQPLDRLMRISQEEALVASQQMTHQMVRGLAHEIKNPLGGLRGAAQLLARELPSAQLKDYTNIIIDEADRLRRLVDRMIGAPQHLQQETINVHEVTERVRQLIAAETGEQIDLLRDYDPSIPDFRADRERLIQAGLNIARNASQILLEHGCHEARPKILFRTRSQRQFTIGNRRHRLVCRIDIVDNGPGISAELAQTLFFPMVSGRPDGTGLGLAISQSILNQHGGLIGCDSKPGETVFSLYVPIETTP